MADISLHTACAARLLSGEWLAHVAALVGRDHAWWLDSALVRPPLGRFSFAGSEPAAIVRAFGDRVQVEVLRESAWPLPAAEADDPLGVLEVLLPPAPVSDPVAHLPFRGGAVGFLGYELAPGLPPLSPLIPGPPDPVVPDLCFLLVDRLIAWDHEAGQGHAVALGFGADPSQARARAEAGVDALLETSARPDPAVLARLFRCADSQAPAPVGGGMQEELHAKCVARIQEHIAAGDCYQACLTHRIEVPFAGHPLALHAALRASNPAPFAAYLSLPDFALVGSSPERFLRLDAQGWAESRPIKGTRPRCSDPAKDRAQREALVRSEKDRAENLMIVDLVRNDLGRVCEAGSIHVPELMVVEDYASVFQLVSTVRGRLRAGQGALDAIRATFPPGSMTGAPKLAAMQILERLEAGRRGPYAGALGYLDVGGGCDLSVVIRTALVQGGRAAIHTGGGIVADSEPAAEWREAGHKARALLEAVAAAEGRA